jgi:signal transduction histidine kinase
MKSNNVQALKNSLIEALQEGDIDYDRVLELSAKLAESDQDNVRFSVDASHISRLGRELVVRKETAVAELVKNGYDADASKISLKFIDTNTTGGTIIIFDDGAGMTRDQIISGFMRLSTTDKIQHPYSSKYKRLRAGRKGIGRFATQRLGKRLTIITQTEDSQSAQRVFIDWEKFEKNQELNRITSQIEIIEKKNKPGTTLIIEDVEEKWTKSDIQRVYRYLSDILQPFPISKKLEEGKRDPGFTVTVHQVTGKKVEEIASTETLFYQYALAEIDGHINEKGKAHWSIKSKILNIDEKGNVIGNGDSKGNTQPYIAARNVHLKAYYYIYKIKEFLPNPVRSLVESTNREQGGIRLYRNGFRVPPYGNPDDDWLRLDVRDARRQILAPIKNQNFLGFIEVTDPEGQLFNEASSREGLLENQAFNDLKHFAGNVLESAVTRVAEVRKKKVRPTQTQISPEERLDKATKDIVQAVEDISKLDGGSDQETKKTFSEKTRVLSEVLVPSLKEAINAQADNVGALLEEISMLRILASLGLAIGEFTHEIREMFGSLEADTNNILEKANTITETHNYVQRLNSNLKTFKTYTAFFDRTVAANAQRDTEPQELNKVINIFWKLTQASAKDRGIEIPKPSVKNYDLFTTPMHPSEWTSILFNLYTNAYKAIVRAQKARGSIKMIAGRDEKNVFLEFCDNGIGVPEGKEERIFDAFYTTSPLPEPAADPIDELQGSGLGLKIIRDIVESYGGNIQLSGAPKGYETCFRIELPAATEEEKREYDY